METQDLGTSLAVKGSRPPTSNARTESPVPGWETKISHAMWHSQKEGTISTCIASLVAEFQASACNEGDLGSIPGSGRSPGEGNGNPLQYSCLENPMDREAWGAIVHGSQRVGHD